LGVRPDAPLTREDLRRARAQFESEARLTFPTEMWLALEALPVLTPVDVFLAVVEQSRPTPDLRVIEKTPLHVLHLNTIGEAFTDAVFVNVVRDPIDVASSLQGVPFTSSRSMLSHAQRWLESIEAAQLYARAHA